MKKEYDEIKGFLNKIRLIKENTVSKNNNLLNEQSTEKPENNPASEQYSDVEVVNDVEIKLNSTDREDVKLDEDEKKTISQLVDNFRQQVSEIADLDPGFTISEKQIRLDGNINDGDLSFVFIAGEEDGVYINCDMLELTQEIIDDITKLNKFQETFKSTFEPLIKKRMTN